MFERIRRLAAGSKRTLVDQFIPTRIRLREDSLRKVREGRERVAFLVEFLLTPLSQVVIGVKVVAITGYIGVLASAFPYFVDEHLGCWVGATTYAMMLAIQHDIGFILFLGSLVTLRGLYGRLSLAVNSLLIRVFVGEFAATVITGF